MSGIFDDEEDESQGIAIWLALGITAIVVLTLVTWTIHSAVAGSGSEAGRRPSHAAFANASPDTLHDIPLSGELLGKIYFESGKADEARRVEMRLLD